jgi:hypothetical protein
LAGLAFDFGVNA